MSAFLMAILAWGGPLDEPFADKPATLRKLADRRVPSDWVDVLLEERRIDFDEAGLATETERRVYVIRNPEAIADWARTGTVWSPWFQERPEFRARVIDPSGSEHWFDPADLVEAPVASEDERMWVDDMSISGPLPQVAVGSIIEEEIVTRAHQTRWDGGELYAFGVPNTDRIRVLVTAPEGQAPQVRLTDLTGELTERVRKGQHTFTFEKTAFEDLPPYADFVPVADRVFPHIGIGTGGSWVDLATAYGRHVDTAIDNLPESALNHLAGADDPDEVARLAYEWVRDRIRYTGMELGAGALLPRPSSEVVGSGWGDCKDQSALLVGLLRARGVEAHLALIRTGGADMHESAPGIDAFNHAIVHIPDGNRWLDPTSDLPFGEVPYSLVSRQALVVNGPDSTWSTLPTPDTQDNWVRETRQLTLTRNGAQVTESSEAKGWPAQGLRSYGPTLDPKDYAAYVEGQYVTTEVTSVTGSANDRSDQPATLTLTITGSKIAASDIRESQANLQADVPLSMLSEVFSQLDPRRAQNVQLPVHRYELLWQVTPPPDQRLLFMPEGFERQFGPLTLSAEWTEVEGQIEGRMRLDTGDGVLTPKALGEFFDFVRQTNFTAEFNWLSEPAFLTQEGQLGPALKAWKALAEDNPADPELQATYAIELARLGFREEADAVLKAAQVPPEFEGMRQLHLGVVWLHNSLGQEMAPGLDLERSLKHLKASDAAGTPTADRLYGLLLQFDTYGHRWSMLADLPQAVEVLSRALANGHTDIATDLAICLLRTGQPQRTLEVLSAHVPEAERLGVYVAALAAYKGPETARNHVLQATFSDVIKGQVLAEGASQLAIQGDFETAVVLTRAAASLGHGGSTKLAPVQEQLASGTLDVHPATLVVRDLAIGAIAGNKKAIQQNLSRHSTYDPNELGGDTGTQGMHHETLGQLVGALATVVYEVPEQVAAVRPLGVPKPIVLVWEGGAWRALDEGGLSTLAPEIRRSLKKGDRDRAWHLTTLAFMGAPGIPDLRQKPDPQQASLWMELAAWAASPKDAPPDLQALPDGAREAAQWQVAETLRAENRLDAMQAYLASIPRETTMLQYYAILAEALAGNPTQVEAMLASPGAVSPAQQDQLRITARLHQEAADPSALLELARDLAARPQEQDFLVLHPAAWALTFGTLEDRQLGRQLLETQRVTSQGLQPDALHTLAVLQALSGNLQAAMDTHRQDATEFDSPPYGLVRGYIAESVGLTERALIEYRRVEPEENLTFDTYRLAQDRIQALESP